MVEQQLQADPGAAVQPPRGSPLARPDFRLLVAGQMISTAGDMFFLVAVPFLIFSTGGTAATLTATLTTFGLTRLAIALPAGALADRVGPRPVMLAADALRTVAVLVLALAAATGRPGLAVLIAVGAALGIGEGCYRPAARAMTPLLVPDEQLPAANSINISANLLATVVGPALGGLGVALGSPALVLGLDAVSFVCSVVTLLLIRGGRGPVGADVDGAAGEPHSVLAFFRASAFFRVTVLMNAVIGLSIAGALQVALPVLARHSPGLGVTGYGYLMTALGVGMVAGGLSGGRLAGRRWQGRLVIVLLAVNATLLAVLPGVPGTVAKLAVMAVLGASDGALSVIVVTVLQRMPPPRLRGRVLAVLAFVNFVMYPLSVAGAGGLLSRLDPAAVFQATGIGVGLVAVIGAMSRSVRDA